MAEPVTLQSQIDAIRHFRAAVYYNGVYLGFLEANSLKITSPGNMEGVGSTLTGENGFIKHVFSGSSPTIEFNMLESNKKKLLTAYSNILTEGTTATDLTNPHTGAVKWDGSPRTIDGLPLVIYPMVTASNGTALYGADTSNPYAMAFWKAVVTSDFEMSMEGAQIFPITFECQADLVNHSDTKYGVMDDGITTAGVYTA